MYLADVYTLPASLAGVPDSPCRSARPSQRPSARAARSVCNYWRLTTAKRRCSPQRRLGSGTSPARDCALPSSGRADAGVEPMPPTPPLPSSLELELGPAEPRHAAGLAALFASNGYGCYCRSGTSAAPRASGWSAAAQRPEENCSEMQAARGRLPGDAWGGGDPGRGSSAGSSSPRTPLRPSCMSQRLYKDLPCFTGDRRDLVRRVPAGAGRPAPSGRGPRAARERCRAGARVGRQRHRGVSAQRPRSGGPELDARTHALFLEAGFEVAHDFYPYPCCGDS
jgi:hypothetical protein